MGHVFREASRAEPHIPVETRSQQHPRISWNDQHHHCAVSTVEKEKNIFGVWEEWHPGLSYAIRMCEILKNVALRKLPWIPGRIREWAVPSSDFCEPSPTPHPRGWFTAGINSRTLLATSSSKMACYYFPSFFSFLFQLLIYWSFLFHSCFISLLLHYLSSGFLYFILDSLNLPFMWCMSIHWKTSPAGFFVSVLVISMNSLNFPHPWSF